MNPFARHCISFVVLSLIAFSSGHAAEVTLPISFTAGTPAVAAQVNANFTAVKSAVDDNDSRVAALEAAVTALQATAQSQAAIINGLQITVSAQAVTIAALQSNLAAVQTSQVMALEPYVSVDETSDPRGPLVQLTGVNLQIVNGAGGTDTVNGLGNLIIGYDEVNTDVLSVCSDGAYSDPISCSAAGETWSNSHKTGSHYLVTGSHNNYSRYGGLVAGGYNFVNGAYSTVSGGDANIASGSLSSVSGGVGNVARGSRSSVSGGQANTAGGSGSSVSGGSYHEATGVHDWAAGSLYEDD